MTSRDAVWHVFEVRVVTLVVNVHKVPPVNNSHHFDQNFSKKVGCTFVWVLCAMERQPDFSLEI